MVKARTWFSLFIMSVATVAATASCGNDEGTGGGAVLGNAGSSGHSGAAGASSVGRAGDSSTAGVGTVTGDVNSPISTLGATCTTDKQCGTGQVCMTASSTSFTGGGPAGGLCTLACTATADCTAIEPGSDCFNLGTDATPKLYCLAACAVGGDVTTTPNKCQGRNDIACVDLSTTSTPDPFCIPLCRSDLECGTGLYCNKGSGLCSKTKPAAGDPIGTDCTPSTADTSGTTITGSGNCEGFCIRTSADGVTPAKGKCAEFCAGDLDCLYNGDKPGGICLGAFSADAGLLDLGYCLPNCNCSGDCPIPGDMCRAWTTAQQSIATDLGAPGVCAADVTGSVELTKCTGTGGAAGSGGSAGAAGGTAGTAGATGGTAGAASGGSAGSAAGGSAGATTGGSGGSATAGSAGATGGGGTTGGSAGTAGATGGTAGAASGAGGDTAGSLN